MISDVMEPEDAGTLFPDLSDVSALLSSLNHFCTMTHRERIILHLSEKERVQTYFCVPVCVDNDNPLSLHQRYGLTLTVPEDRLNPAHLTSSAGVMDVCAQVSDTRLRGFERFMPARDLTVPTAVPINCRNSLHIIETRLE